MESILFEHNRKAYTAAVEMMARTGKAAIVHPTGTGKSFIAFQLCMDNAKSRVCLLSPSEYIFMTQREKWISAGGAGLKNVQFITYARLMRMSDDALAGIMPDYIVLDEFHRCGAAQWGKGVERLRAMYPKAPVLGLSATSIRYLDNQRDMAWELFDGNIASELTLGGAVARGILPAPKYVLSVYSYQKELRRYEARVKQAKSRAVQDEAQKALEALRRALEKADGLAEVFARHMLPETTEGTSNAETRKAEENADSGMHVKSRGKYLVFCSDYEHLLEMRQLAPKWFAKVDSAPHIYTAYSDDPAASEEFEAFKADMSKNLKLLYCIDMLNEGVHVDGLDGVILLRPTVSPIIYKQQIGRALAAGRKKTPVIFDIVMNIENLCSIGVMEEELREAVSFCYANGSGNEVVHERFGVVDELGDCRQLFGRLNEILGASWETMYAKARDYFAEHGALDISAVYTTPEGYSLGAWVATQRKVYAGKAAGNLSEEQIVRLEKIGMRWQGTQEVAWEQNFSEAEKYFKEHGDLSIPKRYVAGSGKRLGAWVQRQRVSRKSGQLTGRQVTMLDKIGMVWEPDEPWKVGFRHARDYFRENGHLEVPNGYVCGDGYRLGKWISNQRSTYAAKWCGDEKKLGKGLTREKIARLNEIGMVWSAKVGRHKAQTE